MDFISRKNRKDNTQAQFMRRNDLYHEDDYDYDYDSLGELNSWSMVHSLRKNSGSSQDDARRSSHMERQNRSNDRQHNAGVSSHMEFRNNSDNLLEVGVKKNFNMECSSVSFTSSRRGVGDGGTSTCRDNSRNHVRNDQ